MQQGFTSEITRGKQHYSRDGVPQDHHAFVCVSQDIRFVVFRKSKVIFLDLFANEWRKK